MSITPVEDTMRLKVSTKSISPFRSDPIPPLLLINSLIVRVIQQINEALKPTSLEIFNDSDKHAHHKAMEGSQSKETHFRLIITSEAFKSKPQPARHRMIYALLKEELDRPGGIHALQLRTRTPEEEAKQVAREKEERGERIGDVE